MSKLTLGKVCTACGKERKTKVLGYHPSTLAAYCTNPYVCNEDHPNSVANLIASQKETKFITFEEANEAHKEQLLASFDANTVEKIQKMLTRPITIRIHDPKMAEFIIKFQEDSNLGNTSEVFWYAIETLMENKGVYLKDHMQKTVEKKVEAAAKEAVEVFAAPKQEEEEAPKQEEKWTF